MLVLACRQLADRTIHVYGPCAFVFGVLLLFLWPNDFHTFTKIKFKQLDYPGMILVMIGATLPVFILNEAAARQYAWNSATTIAVLVISGLVWIFLVLWQWQVSKRVKLRFIQPQLPFSLLKDRVLLSIFTYVLMHDLVSSYSQETKTDSTLIAAPFLPVSLFL